MKITYKDYFKEEIIHTFLYYDRPLFYISLTEEGKKRMYYLIDEDRKAGEEQWFVAEITDDELCGLMKLEKEVKQFLTDKIKNQEMFYAYFSLLEEEKEIRTVKVTEENLDEEAMPTEKFFVGFDYKQNKDLTEELK